MKTEAKRAAREKRHTRVRKKIAGSQDRPRLAVFRSNRHIYAQLIDDGTGRTLAASSTLSVPGDGSPLDQAKAVGTALAEKAREAGVTSVRFDRGGFQYHGRVKALADAAREGGLEF